MITFLTGPRRCFLASAPLVNRPVDSMTMSAPTLAQSISAGSFTLKTLKAWPSTEIESSVCVTLCGRLQDGIVLKQVREGLGVGDVVDGDELYVLVVQRGAHDVPSDAAEAVDADLDGHTSSDGLCETAAGSPGRNNRKAEPKMLGAAWRKVNAKREIPVVPQPGL